MLDAVHFDVNTMTDTLAAPSATLLGAATHDIQALNALLALDGNTLKSAAAGVYRMPALRDLPDYPGRRSPTVPRRGGAGQLLPRAGLRLFRTGLRFRCTG